MSAFSPARRAEVTARAGGRREYCHLPTRGQWATFPIDHIVPRSAGGSNDPGNLALTCPRCNAYKWEAVEAVDPQSGEPVRLFDPRQDAWDNHFAWAVGRAMVAGLRINGPDSVEVRMLLAGLGLFPEAGQ